MGFDVPYGTTQNRSDRIVTQDPLRNGTLLCALVQMLDPDHGKQILSKVIRNPLSIKQASNNVHIALKVLRSRRYSAIPAPYLHQPESIVKGHRAVLWGLLWHMKRTIDTFVPDPNELHSIAGRTPSGKAVLRQRSSKGTNDRRVHFDQTGGSTKSTKNASAALGTSHEHFYTRQESWQLERSLLSWIFSLGCLSSCYPTFEGGVPSDLTDIEISLRNGTLLCTVAETVTMDRVRGWMKRPKTDLVGRNNIEKSLTLLRSTDGFGQRFTWKGDDMHSGSRHDILGILEDCHRYQDGLAPRSKFYHPEGATNNVDNGRPYFGSHVPDAADMEIPTPNYTYPKFDTPSAYVIGRGSHLGMTNNSAGMGTNGASRNMLGGNTLDFSHNGGSNLMTSSTMAASTHNMMQSNVASEEMSSRTTTMNEGGVNQNASETITRSASALSAVAASRSIPLVPSPRHRNNVQLLSTTSTASLYQGSSFNGGERGGGLVAPRDPASPSFASSSKVRFASPSSSRVHPFNNMNPINSNLNNMNNLNSTMNNTLNSTLNQTTHYVSHVSAVASTSSLMQDLSMQRDASNDIIPLPGARDINDGRIPISSGVGPEHSLETVHEANLRHQDVVRAMRHDLSVSGNRSNGKLENNTALILCIALNVLFLHLPSQSPFITTF